MLCAKFGLNLPGGSGEKVKTVKSMQTNRKTYVQTRAIRNVFLCFLLR